MSFQATRFIVGLTDLNSSQKSVAHTLAYHANRDGGNSYPSMETIARESGLQSRRSAQRVVRQLEKKEVIVAVTAKTGGRGRDKATVYRLNLDYKSPVNSDTTVALSDQQTATPESRFTVDKQRPGGHESATLETTKCDIQGPKQRHPGHTNSNEQSRRVSEEANPEQSDVQEPHTPILNLHRMEENDEQLRPNQTIIPDHQNQPTPSSKTTSTPNRPVQASKEIVAAPAPPPEYGTPAWLVAQKATMSDEDRVIACIAAVELNGNRTFKCNGKIRQIVRDHLANGIPWLAIVDAANHIGSTLDERDRVPALTLEHNLSATITVLGARKVGESEEQKRREKAAEWDRAQIAELNAMADRRNNSESRNPE